jgi:hypothetical protein
VRLTVEDGAAPAVPRERIVREWEDEMPSGVPSRAVVSLESAATTGIPGNGRKAEPFKPLQIPSVLGSPVEYVIVTTDAMAPAFQQLADWKTQAGSAAVVRTMSFIRQQYPVRRRRRRARPHVHPRRLLALGHQVGAARGRHRRDPGAARVQRLV